MCSVATPLGERSDLATFAASHSRENRIAHRLSCVHTLPASWPAHHIGRPAESWRSISQAVSGGFG
jgi:hypothetical protein